MLAFVGSKATSVAPKMAMASAIGFQVVPPSVVFHKPPAGVQAKSVLASVGWARTALTRPLPPPEGVLLGPISDQVAPARVES